MARQVAELGQTFHPAVVPSVMLDNQEISQLGTTISQVQRLLGDQKTIGAAPSNEANESTLIKALNMRADETDPAHISMINDVLDTLKHKNNNQQQADGEIAEFMQPNAAKI